MSLALNKPKLDNLAGDIWKSAERLRGKFKAYEYQNVILPIIVIRRLECVLIDWREQKVAEVLAKRPNLKNKEKELAKLVKDLELNPKQCPFSNQTDWTLRRVYEEDPALREANFRAYINGFSQNVDDNQERPAGHRPPRQLAHPARPTQQGAGRPVAGAEMAVQPDAEQSALRRHLGRQGRLRSRGAQAGNHPLPGRDAALE